MYKKGLFDKFSTEQLKDILTLATTFEGKDDLLMGVSSEIKKREAERKQSLNVRFTIEMFKDYNMFYPDEMRVLELNGIKNLQDLIDCDLNSMIGITESIKEKLEWARNFYNLMPKKQKSSEKYKSKK